MYIRHVHSIRWKMKLLLLLRFNRFLVQFIIFSLCFNLIDCTDVYLVDVSDQLPRLLRDPGLTTWTVCQKTGEPISMEDALKSAQKLPETLFPPNNDFDVVQLTKWYNVHPYLLLITTSMRLLPYHQNTGGFFVAVFEKKPNEVIEAAVKSIDRSQRVLVPAKRKPEETTEDTPNSGQEVASAVTEKHSKGGWGGRGEEEPFILVDSSNNDLASIK